MLRLVIPKGSLEEQTLRLLEAADLHVRRGSPRDYHGTVDDERIERVSLLRPQEIPTYIQDGLFDLGITGRDWIDETGADVEVLASLEYAKSGTGRGVRIVLAVPGDHPANSAKELPADSRISTEYVNLTRRYFHDLGIPVRVVWSYGATEAKVPEIVDAIVDVTETGSTLRAHGMRVIETLLESEVLLIANRASAGDPTKRAAMDDITTLLLADHVSAVRRGLRHRDRGRQGHGQHADPAAEVEGRNRHPGDPHLQDRAVDRLDMPVGAPAHSPQRCLNGGSTISRTRRSPYPWRRHVRAGPRRPAAPDPNSCRESASFAVPSAPDDRRTVMRDLSHEERLRREAACLKSHWETSPRWRGIERTYTAEDVIGLRGTIPIEHTLARLGADRLWTLMRRTPFVAALGAMTGGQALQMVKAGLDAVYVSGWQVAADANLALHTYPDQSLYPSNSVPALVRRINNALAASRPDRVRQRGDRHQVDRADHGRRRGRVRRRPERLRDDEGHDRGGCGRRAFRGSARE